MKNIASKKDIIDQVSGYKIYTEGGIIPTPSFLESHVSTIGEEHDNVVDGDSYTIDGIKYTYRTLATQPNDREIGGTWSESLNYFLSDLANAGLNGNVPRVEVDITGIATFIDLYHPYFNLGTITNGANEGDFLTIGETTYTFTSNPTGPFDISTVDDPGQNFYNFIQSNPNEDIIGASENCIFCTDIITSIANLELITPKGIKKLDVDVAQIIFNATKDESFLLPGGNRLGRRILIINHSEVSTCTINDLHNYENHIEIGPRSYISIINNIDGWYRLAPQDQIIPIYMGLP